VFITLCYSIIHFFLVGIAGDGSSLYEQSSCFETRMERAFCSCCFLFVVLVVTSGEQLLHSVAGEVGRGNYTYYSLMYEGPIVLYLYSE
jgi:hypothetical protein